MVLPTDFQKRLKFSGGKSPIVCHFWKLGKCDRNPCRFVHGDLQPQQQQQQQQHHHCSVIRRSNVYRAPTSSSTQGNHNKNVITLSTKDKDEVLQKPKVAQVATQKHPSVVSCSRAATSSSTHGNQRSNNITSSSSSIENKSNDLQKPKVAQVATHKHPSVVSCSRAATSPSTHGNQGSSIITCSSSIEGKSKDLQKSKVATQEEKPPCEDWMSSGNCNRGDACPFLHSWFYGDAFSMVARLEGHCNNVSGIDLSIWRKKLISCSSDGIVNAWDCLTGTISRRRDVGEKIGCLISEGDWLFLGLSNSVKAINTKSGADCNLSGPTGEVYALETGLGVLYAACQDGMIVAWRVDLGVEQHVSPFQPPVYLKGHTSGVICLRFGAGRLFSGSMDGTIITWDNNTLESIEITKGHDDAVMSLLCYESFLLSCSLDQKIKVWATNEKGILDVKYTHEDEDCGALALCGMENPNGNNILLCSWNNDTVSIYELPSFEKRGKMYAKGEVRTMRRVSDLLFTGDATGLVTVWKLAQPSEA
ncbi:Zinc finger CCCH domain-containing protein 17 [Linum grandiflorum]